MKPDEHRGFATAGVARARQQLRLSVLYYFFKCLARRFNPRISVVHGLKDEKLVIGVLCTERDGSCRPCTSHESWHHRRLAVTPVTGQRRFSAVSPKSVKWLALPEGFSHLISSMTARLAYRPESLPGGTCAQWKAPPLHSARSLRTLDWTEDARPGRFFARWSQPAPPAVLPINADDSEVAA